MWASMYFLLYFQRTFHNTNITKKFEITKYFLLFFYIFCIDSRIRTCINCRWRFIINNINMLWGYWPQPWRFTMRIFNPQILPYIDIIYALITTVLLLQENSFLSFPFDVNLVAWVYLIPHHINKFYNNNIKHETIIFTKV